MTTTGPSAIALVHVHLDPTPITSELTGRTIYFNEHDTALAVLPTFSADGLVAAAYDWRAHLAEIERAKQAQGRSPAGYRIPAPIAANIEACLGAADRAALAASLDLLIEQWRNDDWRRHGRRSKGLRTRMMSFVVTLWRHDLVALPVGAVWRETLFHADLLPRTDDWDYGPLGPLITELRSGSKQARGKIHKLFLTTGGAEHVGDFGSSFFAALGPHAAANTYEFTGKDGSTRRASAVGVHLLTDRLALIQRSEFSDRPDVLAKIPQSYRSLAVPRSPGRMDPEYAWVAEHGPRLARWRDVAAAYVASAQDRARLTSVVQHLNPLLDYVAGHADVPADPLDYCRADFEPAVPYLEHIASLAEEKETENTFRTHGNAAREFFRYVLKPHVRNATYRNPIDRDALLGAPVRSRNGKTYRSTIPLRFLRMMVDIVEARPRNEDGTLRLDPVTGAPLPPTYEWAKRMDSDYFDWRNPETGVWERVWSPVRALFALTRLDLPLRGYQVQMLDSGEGDPEVYRPERGGWVKNTGPLAAPAAKGRKAAPQGFIRRIRDAATGGTLNGLYVNTNKTADRRDAWETTGYEIPWQAQEVLSRFVFLRDWQERYNPIHAPIRRETLHDLSLRPTPRVAKRLQPVHFLFRDPYMGRHPHEPVTDGRAKAFWLALLDELERRLDEKGIRNLDGQKIVLITRRDAGGRPATAEYDQHSLRVSGLTHFAGYVPITILSAFVAGHATTVMTYYYVRPHAGDIHDKLQAARSEQAREDVEERDFAAWMRDVPLKALAEAVAYNDVAAVERLRSVGTAGSLFMEHGVCPAGGALCHEGGPLIHGSEKGPRRTYAPVPGGARNCPRCRFFVTGRQWRGGLAALYNAKMGELVDAISRLRTLEEKERDAQAQYGDDPWSAKAHADPRLRRAEEAVATHHAKINELIETLAATDRLIKDVERAAAAHAARGGGSDRAHALVAVGAKEDIEYALALQPTTEFDLWDRICESSEWYPSIDARTPAVHRGRLYDRMLAANGQKLVFATLTPEEAVETGNAMSRWLRTTLGDDDTNAVMSGQKLLAEVGLSGEVTGVLGAAAQPFAVTAPRQLVAIQRPARKGQLPAGTTN